MQKIKFLLLILLISFQHNIFGQNPIIKPSDPVSGSNERTYTIQVDSPKTKLGKIIAPGDFRKRGVKRTLTFLEFGDGAFSVDEISSHSMKKQTKNSFLFAASIYDTTRPKAATRLGYLPKGPATTSAATYSSNISPLLEGGKRIMLIPNVTDIAQGDYNNFVLTYKIPDTPCNSAIGCKYRIVVFYNGNPFYDNGSPVFDIINGADILPNGAESIRLFYDDQLETDDAINEIMRSGIKSSPEISFQNAFTINCGQTNITDIERNLFFTTYTNPNVALNSATSLYAVLIRSTTNWSNWEIMGDYLINNMSVALAHDPNFIRQTGQCILLPKKIKKIRYHVHFQNDGKGEAGRVDVNINLPWGINDTNIEFDTANCGAHPYKLTKDNTIFDKDKSILKVSFKNNVWPFLLKGTDNNTNPAINPNTMGDIFFTVTEKVITTDTLPAYAEIKFYNKGEEDGEGLPVILTNLAVSVYREACDGKNMNISVDTAKYWKRECINCRQCRQILHICWYWWLLLIPLFWIGYRVYKKYTSNTGSE
jgi:hypothetical protein